MGGPRGAWAAGGAGRRWRKCSLWGIERMYVGPAVAELVLLEHAVLLFVRVNCKEQPSVPTHDGVHVGAIMQVEAAGSGVASE